MGGVEVRRALDRLVRDPFHSGAALSMVGPSGEGHFATGDLTPDRPVFFASTTKLFVTVVLRLLESGGLSLDTPFRAILEGEDTARLWLRDGTDRTGEITLRHLMAHVSGLPDYLGSATPRKGLMGALLRGEDRGWALAEALEMARAMGPVGVPGAMARAQYSDTNFQILGAVIETVEGAGLAEVIDRRIVRPLGLTRTWLYADPGDTRPAALRYRGNPLHIPRAMVSFRGDGALVSTPRDGLAFLRALWQGAFGPPERFIAGTVRPVFFPLRYGDGIMRFGLPRWMTGFRRLPVFWGHSGMSGALMFHAPEVGLSVAATVNQIDRPGTVFRLMLKAL